MNCLELFSGTHSVGKVLERLGHKVISLDLKGATINVDILKWDYKVFPPNHFDYIHASPPCNTFSMCRRSWIGRQLRTHGTTIITKEILDNGAKLNEVIAINFKSGSFCLIANSRRLTCLLELVEINIFFPA